MNSSDPTGGDSLRLLVGTYTHPVPGGAEGILGVEYGEGGPGEPRLLARLHHPSWLAPGPDGRHLYAVSETEEHAGEAGGEVVAFALDPGGPTLTELNRRNSGGGAPAHLAVDPTGRFVVVANYASGSVTAFPIEADGSLGAPTGQAQHTGSGPQEDRQEGPHAHMAAFDPVRGDLLVPDLGIDAVVVYTLTPAGELQERKEARIPAAPGAGPRHLAFHPGGQVLFCVNELACTVAALRRAGDGWASLTTTSVLPGGVEAGVTTAAVRVTPSGRYVLASIRGAGRDGVAMLRFDEASGTLELVHVEPSGGATPREIVVTPDGAHLLVANQDSDSLVLMEIDEAAGVLRPVSSAPVPSPVCLVAL